MRADEVAAAAVEAAVRWHLGDLCKRLGLPKGGSSEQLKSRVVEFLSGRIASPESDLVRRARLAALEAMGRPATTALGTHADFEARICVWRALKRVGIGASPAARIPILGHHFERTTIMAGVRRWTEMVEAGGPLGDRLQRGHDAALEVVKER